MVEVSLNCLVVGEGAPISIDIDAGKTVNHLKDIVKEKNIYQYPAKELELYHTLKGHTGPFDEGFLHELKQQGSSGMTVKYVNDIAWMNPIKLLKRYFEANPPLEERIHVLVVVPESAILNICPRISVTNLLRQKSLPGMEFMEAMKQPVSFKIPILNSQYVSMWPDSFTQGLAEYGASIDAFLDHAIVSGSELGVVSIDSQWLNLFLTLCQCVIYQDESHESSSRQGSRPDAVIVKGSVLVGKVEAKASQKKMATAMKELTEKMADAAYCTFPLGITSIPAWTTCATLIQLHQLSYLPATKTYETRILESYNATDANHRQQFVVDLFKILMWVIPIQEPNALMHLFPQVRTTTTNGHYVTWLKTGLVKQFRKGAEIDMEIIRRIYNADFQHVERGICNHASVTITSIGQTLQNALADFQGKRNLIIEQVKKALAELHSIGVAHCDVRAANVFVLLSDKRVILGDLEYCRPLHAPPPDVKRKNKSCKTALDLDNYQLGIFVDELAQM
ncbi:Aste57867_7269 [Aphanomyces stellatus]|uniref:Aste57867_7269 protein n=1 Tax=Aphanomyces stellatus TaxID=120398 RepID=A0A485KI35_9STRA|nr:hypothetical protein As57867_007244 [Aphanomyces stellatus]VFT84191.1 Aste57867_7269 [Aphanomyces stellatus]